MHPARTLLLVIVTAMLMAACSANHDPSSEDSVAVVPDSLLTREADSLFRMAISVAAIGLTDSAIDLHERALHLRLAREVSDVDLAYSYWKTGRLLHLQMKVEAASQKLDRAITIAEEFNAPADSMVIMYLHAGISKGEMLDNTSAISLVKYAEQIVLTQFPENETLRRQCLSTMANIHMISKHFQEAEDVYRRILGTLDPRTQKKLIAVMYFNIALANRGLKKFDRCLVYLNKTLAIRSATNGLRSYEVSSIYLNKGDVFSQLGFLDSASYYFRACLNIRQEEYGEKSIVTAGGHEAMGNLYDAYGVYDSAMYHRQAQLRSLIADFNSMDVNLNPKPKQEEISLDLVDYLIEKASTLKMAYGVDSSRRDLLEASLNSYLLADSVYTVFQGTLAYDDLKLTLRDAAPIPYSEMLEVTYKLYSPGKEKRYLQVAQHIMEYSKATVLKEALGRIESSQELGLQPELLAREKRLMQRRSAIIQKLSGTADSKQKRDSLNEAIVKVDKEYDRLKIEIAADKPNYLLMRFGSDVDIDRLTNIMKKKQAVWIEYFWGRDKVHILSAGPGGARLREVLITPELLSMIDSVASEVNKFDEQSITKEKFSDFGRGAYFIFNQLVAPALQGYDVRHLIIAPSGPLMSFPFEALITSLPGGDEVDYRLNYLVKDYYVSYQYSCSFLSKQITASRHGDKLLAVAHAAIDEDNDAAGDLPGAREEIKIIDGVMTKGENKYLLQDQASESEFKRNAEKYNLLHLAIHGVADTVNAMESHLIFRNAGESGEDGKLYAHELYTMDLQQADLAVLTACESGVGRLQAGEGMMSIARGFAYAGCPSLVISLWKISDRTSPIIMSEFYTRLSQSAPIDVALTDAKRNYISRVNMLNSHPAFWAAFLAVGDTNPVNLSWRISTLLVVAAGSLAALILVWLVWRKKTSRLQTQVQHG